MTLKEFTDRTGLNVSLNAFEKFNEFYMDLPAEKDEFCAAFKEFSNLMCEASELRCQLKQEVKDLESTVETLKESLRNITERFAAYAIANDDPQKAAGLLGYRGAARMIVKKKEGLSDAEIDILAVALEDY